MTIWNAFVFVRFKKGPQPSVIKIKLISKWLNLNYLIMSEQFPTVGFWTEHQGKMPGQITDDQLKEILLSTRQPKREFKMNRV